MARDAGCTPHCARSPLGWAVCRAIIQPAHGLHAGPIASPSRKGATAGYRGAGIVVASGGEPLFHLIGFLACAGATAARACKSVLQSVLMSHSTEKLDSMVGGVRYQNPTKTPCLSSPLWQRNAAPERLFRDRGCSSVRPACRDAGGRVK